MIPLISCVVMLLPTTAFCSGWNQESIIASPEVSVDKSSFNPSAGEKIGIGFRLKESATVTLKIYDFDYHMVIPLAENEVLEKGRHIRHWNGRNLRGTIVPDESYFFTIEAQRGDKRELYNPRSFSGGIAHEIERVTIDSENGQVGYHMPENGRVFMRAGIHKGPLLAIPVDWEPRCKGWNMERWDGRDQDGLRLLWKHPRFRIRTSYFTLPENTIMTRGNSNMSYLDYKRSREQGASLKSSAVSRSRSVLLSPLYDAGLRFTKSPSLDISFPEALTDETGFPVLGDHIRVEVSFNREWRELLASKQYEIYYYLDDRFLTEDPGVRLPYETVLEAGGFAPGIHILSVNLMSPKGQFAVKSVKLKLQ